MNSVSSDVPAIQSDGCQNCRTERTKMWIIRMQPRLQRNNWRQDTACSRAYPNTMACEFREACSVSTAWDAATFRAGMVQAQSSSAAMQCSPLMCVQQAAACVAYLSLN
jgi:hypothetical protein